MNLVDKVNKKHINPNIPKFQVGDTVRVNVWIKEGKKERIQAFEGVVVDITGGSVSKTFTVRKKSGAVVVKRIFPVNSPLIDSIEVVKKGSVRRANLGFMDRMLGDYKIKERN